MKKFNFRLQKLLEIKQKLRDLQKIDLAKKASEYNLEISKINKLKEEKKKAIIEIKQIREIENRKLYEEYIISNEKMQKYKMMDAKEKEKPFKESLNKYFEKDREAKVLEKLFDKYTEEFRKSSIKEEEKEIDEIFSSKINRGITNE
ncbi:MAG: hypothetical protein ACK4F9_03460 [Brevinematia bacterium]